MNLSVPDSLPESTAERFAYFNFSFFCCESRVLLCFLLPILAPWVKYRREVNQSLSLSKSNAAFMLSVRMKLTPWHVCMCAVLCLVHVSVCSVCHLILILAIHTVTMVSNLVHFVLFEVGSTLIESKWILKKKEKRKKKVKVLKS